MHRAHPLPGVLAETFLEQALDEFTLEDDLAALPRTGAWECTGVDEVTWLAILRIRHKIDARGKLGPKFSMAEEAAAIAFSATAGRDCWPMMMPSACSTTVATAWPDDPEFGNERGLAALPSLAAELNSYAAERAETLADDHTRVRQVLGSRAQVRVDAIRPVDVIGFYVLMPAL